MTSAPTPISQGNPLGYYRYSKTGHQVIMLGTENLSTWTHELIHTADHKISNLKGKKWHKEIVAELGAAILLECLGKKQDSDLGGIYTYIQQYAKEADKDTIRSTRPHLQLRLSCLSVNRTVALSH